MIVETVLQDRKESSAIVENGSAGGEGLLIFEKNDTPVLKKMKEGITFFADDSFNNEMAMKEETGIQ